LRPEDIEGEFDDEAAPHGLRIVTLPPKLAGQRVDKALASLLPELSRGRIQALMALDCVRFNDVAVRDAAAKAQAGDWRIDIPPAAPAEPAGEAIPLDVLFEDAHLIVINKPPGMAAHPGPGTESHTLVNALIHHCGSSLSGIGGVARPGIVHRLDKDTSGVMVAAKTDAAHQGLSALFAEHDIDRVYIALTRGAPRPAKGALTTRIGRSAHDRKKMAVLKAGGREATTHYTTVRSYGPQDRPLASRISCRLETGRTHQIRVHLAHLGCACLGDPVYGSNTQGPGVRAAIAAADLDRQALHAAVLGFVHPITGETLRFETDLPPDMAALEAGLADL
jgi:23S rRNA pseudouridine1911/1915/1917 synthase